MSDKNEFISFMEGAGVLTFGDFTTKSGRKTPYFVNTGNYKTGMHISKLGDYYAQRVAESGEKFDALYGPAYKGITLAAAAAASLYRNHGINTPYFFNRKEAKDHGEGGSLIGYIPKNGDKIIIIEDVVTAGTAVRESLELLKAVADVTVTALFVSVDRMERGSGDSSTLDELKSEFGINVYSIITARDIIDSLPKGDERIAKMEEYLTKYGAKPQHI
jgi:orotate phosphoribosyltransferase